MVSPTVALTVVVGLVLWCGTVVAESIPCTSPPVFASYPAAASFAGKRAAIDLGSHPRARKFRTVLTEGSKASLGFAGFYTVVEWGCGTECQQFALIDARDGSVHFGPGSQLGIEYHLDSLMLIVNPPLAVSEHYGGELPDAEHRLFYTYYILWTEGKQRFAVICSDDPSAAAVAAAIEGSEGSGR